MAADLTGATLLSRTRENRDFRLPAQSEVVLGFDRASDLTIPFEGVSRRHAVITFDGKDYFVEDAGSANGTFLNAVRLRQKERLRHLDVLTLGRRTDLIFVRRALVPVPRSRKGIVSARLEILDGLEAGTRRDLPRGTMTIGRAPNNNIVADSQLVSKVHARIERTGVQLLLTDLQSANGTFVNGEKVDSRVLKNGDEVSVGRSRTYRVHIEEGEVVTSDVSVKEQVPSQEHTSLPMDWRTRLEWSPEEASLFKRERAALPRSPGITFPQQKAGQGETTPAKAAEDLPAKPPGKNKAAVRPPAPATPVKPAPESPKPAPPAAAAAKPTPPAPPPASATPPAKASAPSPTPPSLAPPKPAQAASAPSPASPGVLKPISAAASTPAKVATPPAPSPRPPASPAGPAAPPAKPPVVPPTALPQAPIDPLDATRAMASNGAPKVLLEGMSRTFSLGVGTHEVGRTPGLPVALDTPEVSRHHARFHVTDETVTLEDLKAANGTFVNGERFTGSKVLADGDLVTFGSASLKVRILRGAKKS